MARDLAVKGDARAEVLCLRQALNLNPQNSAACRLMADLARRRIRFRVDLAAAVGGLEPEIVGRPAGVDADSDGVWRSGHRLQRAG